MSASHTPGPWAIGEYGKVLDNNGRQLLSSGLALCCGGGDKAEYEANDRLIAAAPELLEALDALTLVVGLTPIKGNLDALQEAMNQARAAIAKAKGGTK